MTSTSSWRWSPRHLSALAAAPLRVWPGHADIHDPDVRQTRRAAHQPPAHEMQGMQLNLPGTSWAFVDTVGAFALSARVLILCALKLSNSGSVSLNTCYKFILKQTADLPIHDLLRLSKDKIIALSVVQTGEGLLIVGNHHVYMRTTIPNSGMSHSANYPAVIFGFHSKPNTIITDPKSELSKGPEL